jgi:hypothetical protein
MEHQKERVEQHIRMDVAELKATVEQVKTNKKPKKEKGWKVTNYLFGQDSQMDDVLERLKVRWPEFMQGGQLGEMMSLSGKHKSKPKPEEDEKGDQKRVSILTAKEKEQLKDFGLTQTDVEAAIKRYESQHKSEDEEDKKPHGHSFSLSHRKQQQHQPQHQTTHQQQTYSNKYHEIDGELSEPNSPLEQKGEEGNNNDLMGQSNRTRKSFWESTKNILGTGSEKILLGGGGGRQSIKAGEDMEISANFPFGMPVIYFELVQMIIMLTSLYLALWVTNFVIASDTAEWKILTLLPGIGAALVYLSIVKTAALLKAVSTLDNEAVLEVIEQTEGSRLLGITMREKILSRLLDLGEPQAELYTLFHEIDSSRNGSLR